ncbi:hypothetical protein ACFQ34_11915 [Pseudonocardia benzenivorans]|uniref:Membrane protein n=2 Tax=Pseudonocardia TaxID=1847 RepID=F4CRJ3_PSEUX|nr:hypothetical protein [Pseudonocardia dioxanivorans]AEA26201.1 membrane protein [Pseudonocardia dioxanivorans CB1190]GJF03324.1 hypothetical protein PSD17_22840 [Pseudonocardia sp. D17]
MTSVAADLTEVRAAAELLGFALARRARPVEGGQYRALLDRYRSELRFRDVVDTMAEGLGLEVLGTPRSGLVLAPDPAGPFATRLGDLRSTMDADDRLVFGLVLIGIAAYAYPTDADFDDPETKLVEVATIDGFIRAALGTLGSLAGVEGSAEERARAAAQVYADLPQLITTQTGRRARGCTLKAVEDVCGWLVEQGAAREAASLGPDTFHLTDRFRLLVADSAGGGALDALRDLRREDVP